ncbi:hypothetical protein DXT99_25245 [Pontibacter diazotrophicus]|uniref:Mobilization protein n=1 Tax=Pontibacter diazotrophicus TaxID=1400979 RepID=A0A3D8L297_9BACT|nr:hypothetical protein [Pontibacter diazotrophicus]RDV11122.1 hypothetical protein DXT99_25245 [Pontibacter diazotrophicus]
MEEEKPKNPRGGRPELGEKEKRNNNVMLRFTDAEYEALKAEMKDAGFEQAALYLRLKLIARKGQLVYNPRESLDALNELDREVKVIDEKIDQINRDLKILKAQGKIKPEPEPELMEKYTEQLAELTKTQLKVGKVIKGFFRKGDKMI